MTLQDIFDHLNSGELSNLNIGLGNPDNPNEVNPENWDKLVRLVNMGLVNLFTRFPLKRASVSIELLEGKSVYFINSKHSISKPTKPNLEQYVIDTKENPFKDNIFKIEEVFLVNSVNEDLKNLSLDNLMDKNSVRIIGDSLIQFPSNLLNEKIAGTEDKKYNKAIIGFRAQAEKIVKGLGYFDPKRIEIDLPFSHLEALCYFIASRANTVIGFTEGINPASYYYNKYENACRQLSDASAYLTETREGYLFNQGGWV